MTGGKLLAASEQVDVHAFHEAVLMRRVFYTNEYF